MHTNFKVLHSLLLVLVANLSAAQSTFVHNISASAGISFPVGNFAKDESGEGHGFANPGLAAQVFYHVGRDENKLSYLAGLTAIINPLDGKGYRAMWSPTATIEARRYNLFGISGGAVLDLEKSERVTWQLKGTLGIATISYPAHEMRDGGADGKRLLLYKSSADNSINLNGSLGLTFLCKVSSKVRLGGELDFFRSRARYHITYVSDTLPPSYQEDNVQQIAMVNIKICASYSL